MTGIAGTARWADGALAGLGVRDMAGVLVVVLIVAVALCWVLADEDRSRRLAGIIGAWRGARPRTAGQTAAKPPRRQRRAAMAGSGPPLLPGDRPGRRSRAGSESPPAG